MKDISCKWKSKEKRLAIRHQTKHFKSETVTRDKGVHYIMIKD